MNTKSSFQISVDEKLRAAIFSSDSTGVCYTTAFRLLLENERALLWRESQHGQYRLFILYIFHNKKFCMLLFFLSMMKCRSAFHIEFILIFYFFSSLLI